MALAIRNLSVHAYSNGFTLWNYKSGVDDLEMISSAYFNSACDMLTAGDSIIVVARDGARMLLVTGATNESVTTAAFR
jgi:hypothetical protein